jgi:branched-chain amino acid transport system ATP-binding protein
MIVTKPMLRAAVPGVIDRMVEHDMSLVAEVADRVPCMNLGRQLALGSAREVQSDPGVVSAYLGT